jgi:hypothetical protein
MSTNAGRDNLAGSTGGNKMTARITIFSTAVLATLALPALANAQGSKDEIVEAYEKCLVSKAKQGTSTSLDGGRSAIRLMAQCDEKAFAYVDHCVATSSHTRGECQLQSGILAQVHAQTERGRVSVI